MNKTLRYGIFLAIIISGINLFFSGLAYLVIYFLLDSISAKIFFVVLSAILSGSLTTYFIIAASPIYKEFLTTFRRILRLESLSHPLMVKFSHTAPGTYHHTLTVANIAARAAKSIGVDSLLTRVGAYYHDIGKMISPEFYVENQSPSQNNHDELSPQESARIIIEHVERGVELAHENHLPQEVINFIQQHHGTSTVSYFYEKSKQSPESTKKADFKYPGPKPQSPEIGIVMLADNLEAAVRAATSPTLQDIRQIVNDIIEQKLNDGQLENCNFTTKQIIKLRKAFIESLIAIFHQRIQYPDKTAKKST